MNLKGRNTTKEAKNVSVSKKEQVEASSETLIDDAFAEIDAADSQIIPEINLKDVDTSDLDLSSEVQDFIETLPTSEECSVEKAGKREVAKSKKTSLKQSSCKKADEFRKIRQQNEEEFQKYLESFKKAVEDMDVTEYTISISKPFLKTKFETQGFIVSEEKGGLKVSF